MNILWSSSNRICRIKFEMTYITITCQFLFAAAINSKILDFIKHVFFQKPQEDWHDLTKVASKSHAILP